MDHGKLLIIEHDAALRDYLDNHLTDMGYQVRTSATPEEGKELFESEENGFNVILCDIKFPDASMNGINLARELGDVCSVVLLADSIEEQQSSERASFHNCLKTDAQRDAYLVSDAVRRSHGFFKTRKMSLDYESFKQETKGAFDKIHTTQTKQETKIDQILTIVKGPDLEPGSLLWIETFLQNWSKSKILGILVVLGGLVGAMYLATIKPAEITPKNTQNKKVTSIRGL